jgi:hypothetical protein
MIISELYYNKKCLSMIKNIMIIVEDGLLVEVLMINVKICTQVVIASITIH